MNLITLAVIAGVGYWLYTSGMLDGIFGTSTTPVTGGTGPGPGGTIQALPNNATIIDGIVLGHVQAPNPLTGQTEPAMDVRITAQEATSGHPEIAPANGSVIRVYGNWPASIPRPAVNAPVLGWVVQRWGNTATSIWVLTDFAGFSAAVSPGV